MAVLKQLYKDGINLSNQPNCRLPVILLCCQDDKKRCYRVMSLLIEKDEDAIAQIKDCLVWLLFMPVTLLTNYLGKQFIVLYACQ